MFESTADVVLGWGESCSWAFGLRALWRRSCQHLVLGRAVAGAVVLRVWHVPPERLHRDNAMGGLLSETLCFTAAAVQGKGCVGVVCGMLGFPQR